MFEYHDQWEEQGEENTTERTQVQDEELPLAERTAQHDASMRELLGGDENFEKSQLFRLGHQETSWILAEVEGICISAPGEWLKCEHVQKMLYDLLGYEDKDEFEDAIKGSFESFLSLMPHFEIKTEDDLAWFRMLDMPNGTPKKITIEIKSIPDLYRVVLKPPEARIIIPELEFEIGRSNEKTINTIWNHIAQAVFNLGLQAKQGTWSEDVLNKVSDTLGALNNLLDVNQPWTFVIDDPSGTCICKPEIGVLTEMQGSHVEN